MNKDKQKLEPCSVCGFNGVAEIHYTIHWGVFCGPCKHGVVSRFLIVALWKWNHRWRIRKVEEFPTAIGE